MPTRSPLSLPEGPVVICARNTTPVTDASRQLQVVVTPNGFEPNKITIVAGEAYTVLLSSTDGNTLHNWSVAGTGTDRFLRDADGYSICSNGIHGSRTTTLTFTINSPGTYKIQDRDQPRVTGELVVTAARSGPAPLSAPLDVD